MGQPKEESRTPGQGATTGDPGWRRVAAATPLPSQRDAELTLVLPRSLEIHDTTSTPMELLKRGVRGWRREPVMLDNVVFTEEDRDIIDPLHLQTLSSPLDQLGLHSFPLYQPRLEMVDGNEKVVHYIADGFHRTYKGQTELEAARSAGRTDAPNAIMATVFYGLTNEELADQRIMHTNQTSLFLPRLSAFINDSFREGFADSLVARGLKASDAFAFAAEGKRPRSISLSESERTEIRDWVQNKCALWKRDKREINKLLHLVENTDPKLVKRARQSKADADSSPRLIHIDTLREITKVYFGQDNFALQNILVGVVQQFGLDAKQTKAMIDIIKNLRGTDKAKRHIIYSQTPKEIVLEHATAAARTVLEQTGSSKPEPAPRSSGRESGGVRARKEIVRLKTKKTQLESELAALRAREQAPTEGPRTQQLLAELARQQELVARQQEVIVRQAARIRALEADLTGQKTGSRMRDIFRADQESVIDWSSVSYSPTEGEGKPPWFQEQNVDLTKVTMMIHDAAQSVFADVIPNIGDLLPHIRSAGGAKTPERQGYDAIFFRTGNFSVAESMARIAKSGLSNFSPEFVYLSAIHYYYSVNAKAEATANQDQNPALTSLRDNMRNAIIAYQDEHFPNKKKATLLKQLLYASPSEPKLDEVIKLLGNYDTSSYAQDVAENFLRTISSGRNTPEQYFRFRVLGQNMR